MIYTKEAINKLTAEWLSGESDKAKRAWQRLIKHVKYES